MNEKSLMKQAQKDVVEIEWWKDKLFRTMEVGNYQGFVFDYFTEDERKTIFEALKKWRENRSKVFDSQSDNGIPGLWPHHGLVWAYKHHV